MLINSPGPVKVAGLLYFLFVILFIIIIILNSKNWLVLFVILLLSIPYALLTLYDIDCIFNGNCIIWGWIKGVLFMLYLITTIILAIFIIAYARKFTIINNEMKINEIKTKNTEKNKQE
jgi:hypothetical protein